MKLVKRFPEKSCKIAIRGVTHPNLNLNLNLNPNPNLNLNPNSVTTQTFLKNLSKFEPDDCDIDAESSEFGDDDEEDIDQNTEFLQDTFATLQLQPHRGTTQSNFNPSSIMNYEMDTLSSQSEIDCSVSGMGRGDFSKCHQMTKKADRSILTDLDKLNIPNDIKVEAEGVFRQLNTNTKRGRRRKKLLFYCIFMAYTKLGQPKDPKAIADLVGISSTEMTKAFSMCSESQTNYKTPIVHWSPLDFIPEYIEPVGLELDCLDDVLKLGREVLEKDAELYESYPQVVAGCIIMYYMSINGAININKKRFAEVLKKSEMTISKMFKKIAKAHNS